MPELPVLTPKEVVRVLGRNGFMLVRQRGSHRLYKKGARKITVPFHTKDLKRKTLKSIIEQSGLRVEEFKKSK